MNFYGVVVAVAVDAGVEPSITAVPAAASGVGWGSVLVELPATASFPPP